MDANKEKSKLRVQKHHQIKKFERNYYLHIIHDTCNKLSYSSATLEAICIVNNIEAVVKKYVSTFLI